MRNLLISSLLLLASVASAQVKMRDMLKQMPDTLVPYLTENARLDFIDFIDSHMKAEVTNDLDGKSELLKLTDDYALLQLTQSSQLELRLLEVAEPVDSARQLLCVVRTYGTDIRESVIDFYSVRWRSLPSSDRVRLTSDMSVLTLSEHEPTLSLRYECRLDAPANEEQEELSKPSKILKWDGSMFKEY